MEKNPMKKRAVSRTSIVKAIDESNGADSLKGLPIAVVTESLLLAWNVVIESDDECKYSVFEYCNNVLDNFILIFKKKKKKNFGW